MNIYSNVYNCVKMCAFFFCFYFGSGLLCWLDGPDEAMRSLMGASPGPLEPRHRTCGTLWVLLIHSYFLFFDFICICSFLLLEVNLYLLLCCRLLFVLILINSIVCLFFYLFYKDLFFCSPLLTFDVWLINLML